MYMMVGLSFARHSPTRVHVQLNIQGGMVLSCGLLCWRLVLLGVVYIMDHEVIPCSFRICDWLLNSSQDYFNLNYIKEKKVKTMT